MAKRINGHISDLFFNTDVDVARILDKRGHFEAWDRGRLEAEAHDFLRCLEALGVRNIPTASELVDDFLGRI